MRKPQGVERREQIIQAIKEGVTSIKGIKDRLRMSDPSYHIRLMIDQGILKRTSGREPLALADDAPKDDDGVGNGLSEKEQRVLDLLKQHGPLRTNILRTETGMPTHAMRKLLHKLSKRGLIVRPQKGENFPIRLVGSDGVQPTDQEARCERIIELLKESPKTRLQIIRQTASTRWRTIRDIKYLYNVGRVAGGGHKSAPYFLVDGEKTTPTTGNGADGAHQPYRPLLSRVREVHDAQMKIMRAMDLLRDAMNQIGRVESWVLTDKQRQVFTLLARQFIKS